jgi:hypothetical protein
MDATLREMIRQRAVHQCEYCQIHEALVPLVPFHIEHIIAKQHGGDDHEDNLALACDRCNAYKGPNLSSIDPETNKLVPLFHPRQDQWNKHFRIRDGQIIGQTPTGRATARLLNMNAVHRVQLRLLVNKD